MTSAAEGLLVSPGEGKVFGRSGAGTLVTKAGNDDTRGAYTCQEMTVAARFPGVALHVHHREDEALYVLAGECTARVGERTYVLATGAFLLMPRDVPHSFANPSDTETRVLVINSPGAVEPSGISKRRLSLPELRAGRSICSGRWCWPGSTASNSCFELAA